MGRFNAHLEAALPAKRRPTPNASLPHAWKRERLYFQGDLYFRDMLRAIRGARESVDLETYIFEPGRLGDMVVRVLLRATQRGVKVRLLVDGVGSPNFASRYADRLSRSGVPFRVYRSWPVFFATAFRLFRFLSPLESFAKVLGVFNAGKHRDHRKLCVVDSDQVWIGSFNISDWHLEKVKGTKAWRDTGLVLSGVKSPVFRAAFLAAWEDTWPRWGKRSRMQFLKNWIAFETAEGSIRMTVNRHLRRSFRRELLERFQGARKRIWALTPYFVPNHFLLRALADAARRGVDVRLILPGESDVPMVRWVSTSYYPYLLRAKCSLFEYQMSILHAKTLFVDDWVMAGSGNLDQRSLRKDLEVNVLLWEKRSLLALERQFRKDMTDSSEITLQDMVHRPLWLRFLSWFFFRFRAWF
jgi:cardiolipin synthase